MKTLNTAILTAALCCGGTALTARAFEIISVDWSRATTVANGFMTPTELAGAPGVRTTNWNVFNMPILGATLADGTIQNNLGSVVSGLSITGLGGSSGSGGDGTTGTGSPNEQKMFQGVFDKSEGNEGSLAISGIPYASYLLFFYVRPDSGGVAADNARGGYFAFRDTVTNEDLTITTNRLEAHWLKGGPDDGTVLPIPETTNGNGYVLSTTVSPESPTGNTATSGQPTSFPGIQAGHYVVFSGMTNPNPTIFFRAVGLGAGGVAGGNGARRMKIAGFQIVQTPAATLTNIIISPALPPLHAGNPAVSGVSVVGLYDDGTTFPASVFPGVTYESQNTGTFTVDAYGGVRAGNPGTANLVVGFGGFSTTNLVTVLPPTALRLSLTVSNLYVGNNAADKVQAVLRADYADATNVVVTTFGLVNFSGVPANVISVTPGGLVTAIGPGFFNLSASYSGLSTEVVSIGRVQTFAAPITVSGFSINMTGNTNPPPAGSDQAMNFRYLSGAPGARLGYWNNMNLVGTFNTSGGVVSNRFAAPLNSQGNILTNTSVQIEARVGAMGAVNARTTNESVMINTYADQGMNNPNPTPTDSLTVSNIPYSAYDVYLYVFNDSGATNRPGRFIITNNTDGSILDERWRRNFDAAGGAVNNGNGLGNPGNSGNGYVEAVPVNPGVPPTSWGEIPVGNFVRFSGLTNRDLLVGWGALNQDVAGPTAATTIRLRLAGIQIIRSLTGLTATNLYLSTPVPVLMPGSPSPYQVTVLGDFSDGTKGGNLTTQPGISYTSANPSLFTVSAGGSIQPSTLTGTANLVISYQSLSITQAVTVSLPTAVRIIAKPDTLYLNSALAVNTSQETILADFDGGAGNVNIAGFTGLTINDPNPSVASVDVSGLITPVSVGSVDLSVTYLGTTYVQPGGVTVLDLSANPAPILKHRYTFNAAPGSTVLVDAVDGANGVVKPPLAGAFPITFDGTRGNFPANTFFTNAPCIELPAGIISRMGDVTLDFWAGQNEAKPWARIFDAGSSQKGNDPHNSGNGVTWFEFSPIPGGDANSIFETHIPANGVSVPTRTTTAFPIGTEQHVTVVYSPNQNLIKLYVDGALQTTASPGVLGLAGNLDDQNVWFGVSQFNDPVFNGWINQFDIYEGAFSDEDMAATHAAGPVPGTSFVQPTISSSVSGSNLEFTWPGDFLGWKLQVQTNSISVGISDNWVDVDGSTGVTNISVPIVIGNGSVFYRLVSPP
jgi:Concanavalin A-like lectin/glucanases superfamily